MNVLVPLLFLLSSSVPMDFSPDRGLVAYYSFNQCDARDDSGNGSDGRLIGNVGCFCGVEKDGLSFDGSRSYVEFDGPVNQYFTTSDFTLSFYFRPMKYSTFSQSLLSKRETCDEQHMLDFQLDWNQREIRTLVHESASKYYPGLSPAMDTTVWMQVALVREGQRAYTYINGTLRQESRRCSGVDLSNTALLSFSNSPCLRDGRSQPFKGVLDELRVYDRALDAREILALYQLNPVELAEEDCLAMQLQKSTERTYLCALEQKELPYVW